MYNRRYASINNPCCLIFFKVKFSLAKYKGGGGGYSGGDTFSSISNGEGGTSFISKSRSKF